MPHDLGGARIDFMREHLQSHGRFRFPDVRRSSSNFPLGQPAQAFRKLYKSCFFQFRGQRVQQFQQHISVIRHSSYSLTLTVIAELFPTDNHRPPIFTLGKRQHVIIRKPTRCRISKGMVMRPRFPKMRNSFLFTRPAPFHRSWPRMGSFYN